MARRPATRPTPADPRRATLRRARLAAPPAFALPAFALPAVTTGRAALLYAALALVYLAVGFLPDGHLGGTDYTAAGYMMTEFVSRELAAGRLPTWVPDIMGGLPTFANPGSTFHPVRLALAAVLPVARVLPALLAVHFALAGLGAYLLLRELRCRPWVALLGGLAYEFTGALASLLYAGHDGRFIVAASAPLFLAMLHRGVRTGGVAPFVVAALTLGGALLSFQLQSTYYLLLAGAVWAAFALATLRPAAAPWGRWLARRLGLGLGAVAIGFALAAVNLLPLASYVDESPRAASIGRGYDYATMFSMPPSETLGLAVPEQAGFLASYHGTGPLKYHTEYAGALVVALALVGALLCVRDRRWWLLAALGAFGLTLCWGRYTPLYRLYLATMPGLDKFRAPSIALFLVVLPLVAMAGLALERLAVLRDTLRDAAPAARTAALPTWRRVRGALVALVALSVLMALVQSVSGPASGNASVGWLRFALVAAVVGGALAAWAIGRMSTRLAAPLLAVVTVLDLWSLDRQFLLVLGPPDAFFAADDVVDFLRSRPDLGRVWVFPNRMPGDGGGYIGNGHFAARTNYLMRFGIPQVGGEHGNQLQRFNEFAGVGSGDRFVDWHNLVRSRGIRSAAGVRYTVARTDLTRTRTIDGTVSPSGMRPVYQGSATVYLDDGALPRAYLVPAVTVAPGRGAALDVMNRDDWDPRLAAVAEAPIAGLPTAIDRSASLATPGTATIAVDRPDSVVVRAVADRPALLVLSDNYHASWVVTVDGAPAVLHRVNHTFRGVALGAGAHTVAFAFRPAVLYRGLAISLATAAVLLAGGVAWAAWAWRAGRARAGRPVPVPLGPPAIA